MHHVLLSTVIFDSVNHECAWIPLTKHWMFLPKVYVLLFLVFQPISASFSVNWNYYDYSITFTMNVIIFKNIDIYCFVLTYLVCFLCFCLHRFGHFQRCNKTKKYIFWNGNCATYKFLPKIFFITFYLFYELTKYKSITKRPRLVFGSWF